VKIESVGASSVLKPERQRLVFPFTINMGDILPPAALMHGSIVMDSRLLETLPGTVAPTLATTFVGTWVNEIFVSSAFQICPGLL
jgi:hypothetical protein